MKGIRAKIDTESCEKKGKIYAESEKIRNEDPAWKNSETEKKLKALAMEKAIINTRQNVALKMLKDLEGTNKEVSFRRV